MKKNYIALACCLLTSVGLVGCDKGTTPEKPIDVKELILSQTSLTLSPEGSAHLTVTNIEDQSLITWGSSDENVASVFNGYVAAKNTDGLCYVTAYYKNLYAQCTVNVVNPSLKSSIEVSDDNVLVKKGDLFTLSAEVVFNGKVKEDSTKAIKWKSSASHIVSISQSIENECVINAKRVGEADIIVSSFDRDVYISNIIHVTVKEIEDSDFLLLANIPLTVDGYQVEMPAISYDEFKNEFTPSVYFNGINDISSEVTWEFSNDVLLNSNNKFTANRSGMCIASATYVKDNKTLNASVLFDVYKPNFEKDKLDTINIEIEPIKETGSKIDFAYYCEEYNISDEITDLLLDEKSIFSSATGTQVALDTSKVPTSGLDMGNRDIYLVTKRAEYKVPSYICSKFISTSDEFRKYIKPYVGADLTSKVDGLYILNNDINFNGAEVSNNINDATWKGDTGFVGILDGRGHKVSNFSTGSGGLFGKLGSATIKNISFEQVNYTGKQNQSILGSTVYGTIFENVSFSIAKAAPTSFAVDNSIGLICSNYCAYWQINGMDINTVSYKVSSMFGSGRNSSVTSFIGLDTMTIYGTLPETYAANVKDKPSSIKYVPSLYPTVNANILICTKDSRTVIDLSKLGKQGSTLSGVYLNELMGEENKVLEGNGDHTAITNNSRGEPTLFAYFTDESGVYFTSTVFDEYISTASDLDKVYVRGTDNTYNDNYYILANDIDLDGVTVGKGVNVGCNWATGFRGIFNGNGHTISNFTTGYGGIFGWFRGTVKNVTFDDVTLGDSNGASIFAGIMQQSGNTISDITINITKTSANPKSFIFGSDYVVQSIIKNVVINAEGKDISNVFGSLPIQATMSYSAVVLNCNSIAHYGYASAYMEGSFIDQKPEGVVFNQK